MMTSSTTSRKRKFNPNSPTTATSAANVLVSLMEAYQPGDQATPDEINLTVDEEEEKYTFADDVFDDANITYCNYTGDLDDDTDLFEDVDTVYCWDADDTLFNFDESIKNWRAKKQLPHEITDEEFKKLCVLNYPHKLKAILANTKSKKIAHVVVTSRLESKEAEHSFSVPRIIYYIHSLCQLKDEDDPIFRGIYYSDGDFKVAVFDKLINAGKNVVYIDDNDNQLRAARIFSAKRKLRPSQLMVIDVQQKSDKHLDQVDAITKSMSPVSVIPRKTLRA